MLNVVSQFLRAPDKLAHFKAGALAALAGSVLGAALVALLLAVSGLQAPLLVSVVLMLVCAGVGALVAASVAGATKEWADQSDNLLHPGMHGVEMADAVATGLPGVLLCVLLCLLAFQLSAPLVAAWQA